MKKYQINNIWNDEYRIGGASRVFGSFSNGLGDRSRVILKKPPIYIPYFFTFNAQKMPMAMGH